MRAFVGTIIAAEDTVAGVGLLSHKEHFNGALAVDGRSFAVSILVAYSRIKNASRTLILKNI